MSTPGMKMLGLRMNLEVFTGMKTVYSTLAMRAGKEYTDEMHEAGIEKRRKAIEDYKATDEYRNYGQYP